MKKQLNKIAKDTNIFLKKYINSQKYSQLKSPMKYGLFPGGKKIRSKILMDLGSLFSIDYKTLIIVGSAVECIHAYSLIHDDLPCMDDDDIRRGKPSAHIKFGESTAVLAGNSLLTLAFEILSSPKLKLNEKIKINLIKKLSECSGHLGIAGGQYLDLSYERKKISMNKILEMEIKKTGMLERSWVQNTRMPVGLWRRSTAVSTLLTFCPPAPPERAVLISRSFGSS